LEIKIYLISLKEIIKRKWNGGNGREKRIEQQVFENGFIIDNERISKMRYSGYIRQMAYSQMLAVIVKDENQRNEINKRPDIF